MPSALVKVKLELLVTVLDLTIQVKKKYNFSL